MSGKELKDILHANNINLSDLAKKLGYNTDQRLHSALRADDVKTGLVEAIAKAINKSVGFFYPSITGATASGNGVAVSGDGNSVNAISERFITLLENKDKQIAKKDEQMDRLLGMLETKVGTTNTKPENQP